jgi:hypothetical protein
MTDSISSRPGVALSAQPRTSTTNDAGAAAKTASKGKAKQPPVNLPLAGAIVAGAAALGLGIAAVFKWPTAGKRLALAGVAALGVATLAGCTAAATPSAPEKPSGGGGSKPGAGGGFEPLPNEIWSEPGRDAITIEGTNADRDYDPDMTGKRLGTDGTLVKTPLQSVESSFRTTFGSETKFSGKAHEAMKQAASGTLGSNSFGAKQLFAEVEGVTGGDTYTSGSSTTGGSSSTSGVSNVYYYKDRPQVISYGERMLGDNSYPSLEVAAAKLPATDQLSKIDSRLPHPPAAFVKQADGSIAVYELDYEFNASKLNAGIVVNDPAVVGILVDGGIYTPNESLTGADGDGSVANVFTYKMKHDNLPVDYGREQSPPTSSDDATKLGTTRYAPYKSDDPITHAVSVPMKDGSVQPGYHTVDDAVDAAWLQYQSGMTLGSNHTAPPQGVFKYEDRYYVLPVAPVRHAFSFEIDADLKKDMVGIVGYQFTGGDQPKITPMGAHADELR